MNICKYKGYPEYEQLKRDLVNGEVHHFNENDELVGQLFSEYFLGDVEIQGKKLSKADKSVLLNALKDEIFATQTLTEDLKKQISDTVDLIITELGVVQDRLHPAKVISNPLLELLVLNSFKVPLRKQNLLLNVSNERGKFIPILNAELNNYATTAVLSSLKEICLWDEQSGIIIGNNEELTDSIQAYKLSLIHTLCDFVNVPFLAVLGIVSDEDANFYNSLMQNSWERIKAIVTEQLGEINLGLDENLAQNYINPIMAFYVLQNFDTVISNFLSDFITVNSGEFDSLNTSASKYKIKSKKKLNSSYSDDLHSSDGENLLDTILDTFITSTKCSNGMYLDKKFKDNLLCVLKDAIENRALPKVKVNEENAWTEKEKQEFIDILSGSSKSLEDQVGTLINFLKTANPITTKLGLDQCNSLAKRLQKFTDALNNKKQNSSSIEKAKLDTDYNIGAKLISHLSKGVVGLLQVTGIKGTNSITPGTKKKSKEYVRTRLTEGLLDTLSSNHRLLTDSRPLLIGNVSELGIVDLYSHPVQDTLKKITGINFRDSEIITRFSDVAGLLILSNFLKKYRALVHLEWNAEGASLLNANKEFAKKVVEKLVGSQEYVLFSNRLVEENIFEMERMFDQQGQDLARTTISTLSTSLSKAITDFKNFVGSRPVKNILIARPKLIQQTEVGYNENNDLQKTSDFNQHIVFAGDCKLLTEDIIRWIKQNPSEINTAYLNQLYLFNVLFHNTLTFLIDVTSDKVKTPLGNINLENGKDLIESNLNSLKLIKQELLKAYYDVVESNIFNFFERILGQKFDSLEKLDEHLQTNHITSGFINNKLRDIQNGNNGELADPNFIALPEIYYSQDKSGNVFLNRSLCFEIYKSRDISGLLAENDTAVFEHYKNTLKDQEITLTLTKEDIEALNDRQKMQLAWMFFDNVGDLRDVEKKCSKIAEELAKNNKIGENEFFDHFLKKFITLQNIVREADIELFNKHYWVHGSGSAGLSLTDIKSGNKEAITRLFTEEMRKRIEKSTKRNNSQSATLSPMEQGYKYGVPARIRIASIGSLDTLTTNNFGNRGKLHAHDGAIWSSYILRILERNSQLQIGMADSAKIIALEPHDAGFYQVKCADYAMTNEWIRNSISLADSNSDQFVDGKKLYELMLRPAKIDDLIYNFDPLVNLGLPSVYYNFLGRYASLEGIDVVETTQNGITKLTLHPYWIYSDGSNEEVPTDIVAKTLELEQDSITGELILKDLYDLWKFFGAENSISYDSETGKFSTSDISQEYVAYLMCEFAPELKEQMIGKICDPESVKSTPFPINSRADAYAGKELVTATLGTKNYGPQQDYSHQTDEDTIPFTTLVIGAIAFNGENSELVQDLYETIGNITAEALAEIADLSAETNKTDLYRKIGKLVANNLKTNGVISSAQDILELSLKQLVKDESIFAAKSIPFSDTQIYHVATAQILSKLNKMIKQRFAGTAVVQNPAQGIIGVYLDNKGVTYNKSDLINRALDWYKNLTSEQKILYNIGDLYRTDDIVKSFLESSEEFLEEALIFNKVEYLPISKLNIADNITVEFAKGIDFTQFPDLLKVLEKSAKKRKSKAPTKTDLLGPNEIEIESPMVLQLLHSIMGLGKIKNLNLLHSKPRNLSTTQVTFEDVNGIKTNIWLLESTKAVIADTITKGVSEAKWWHHENMKGIGDKTNPYYYATLDDFRNGHKTAIVKDSIVYRGGEEVLPKQYKRKYSIDGSMADIMHLGLDYFKQLAQYRLRVNPNLNIAEFGKQAFAISTNDFDIIFTSEGNSVNSNTILENEGNVWNIHTDNDELIPNIKLPSSISGTDFTYDVQRVVREGEKPVLIIQTNLDVSRNSQYIEELLKNIKVNSTKFTSDEHLFDSLLLALNENKITNDKINDFAQLLYTSFRLTTKTVSVRIPSQSFQSFLSNETVLFTESEDNNGYMNLWEMWFLGSDYDIDKAYTIMFDPGEDGVIEGNAFSDYSSPEALMKSLLLRNPDKNIRIREDAPEGAGLNIKSIILQYVLDNTDTVYDIDSLNKLLDILKTGAQRGNYLTIDYNIEPIILDSGEDITGQVIATMLDLVQKLNAYNAASLDETYKKNKVMAGIRYASQDVHNLLASQVPMAADDVNNAIDESNKRNGSSSNPVVYYNEDPGHIAHFQYQNAIGKEGVGISANAIKVLSAMQQNTNIKIQQNKLTPIVEHTNGKTLVGLSLKFGLKTEDGNGRTVSERILKLPNTPMSFTQFVEFYAPYTNTLPLNDIYRALISWQSYTITNNKEEKFILCYLLLKAQKESINKQNPLDEQAQINTNPSFLETLYLSEQFELNVADMMSIFISLCTDNAKELRLFMIGATPDLLNLPLAMLAVGMDIQDVTDICVQYIVPIMNELNTNRYNSTTEKSVETVITQHRSAAFKAGDFALAETYASLLKIYKVAQEMKLIAQQFKVNQGVSVKPAEVLDFLNNLNRLITNDDNLIDPSKKYTYLDFFDPDPKKAQDNIKNAINNYKATAINVVDIITGSKNFFKLLEACYRMLGVIEDNVAVSHLTAKITNALVKNNVKLKQTDNRRVLQTVQNALLARAFMAMPDITFEKSETARFGEWNEGLAPEAQIGVSTQMKIENLLKFVEDALVPYLQSTYKDNFFILILRKNTATGRYELPFNSFEVKGDLRTKMDITKATIAFSQISSIASGLHTIDGTDISFGDLLYLYATIVNQNRVNSLQTIVKDAVGKGSKLNLDTRISNYLAEIDRLVGISTSSPDRNFTEELATEFISEKERAANEIASIAQAIIPYAEARLTRDNSAVIKDDATGISVEYNIEVGNNNTPIFPLYTMVPGSIVIDNGGHSTNAEGWQEKVASNLLLLLNSYNSSAKVLPETMQMNGNKLLFYVEVPGKMGNLAGRKLVQADIKGTLITTSDYDAINFAVYQAVESLSESLSLILDSAKLIKEPTSVNQHIANFPGAEQLVYKGLGYNPNDTKEPSNFVKNLLNWMGSKQSYNETAIITGAKYIKTHIDKLGDRSILVLNPIDLTSKSAAYTIINLFLDSQIDGEIPSPQRRLAKLLTLVSGENISTDRDISRALQDKKIIALINLDRAVLNWYQGYLDDSTLPQLKQDAYNNLFKFEKALTNLDLYYYSPDTSLENEIGDVFINKETGFKYIYLGDTDTNLMILRNLDPTNDEAVRLTYKSHTEFDTYERILKPRINSDYSTNLLVPNSKTIESYKEVNTTEVNQGDMISTPDGEYYVSTILYERLPNKQYNTIILGSKDGKTLEQIDIRKINKIRRIVPDIIVSKAPEFNVENLPNGQLNIKARLVANMTYGQNFTYYSGNLILEAKFKSYSRDYISTIDGKLIPLETLCSIDGYNLSKIYPKLNIDTAANTIIVDSKSQIPGAIYGRPEFKYGYVTKSYEGLKMKVTPRYVVSTNAKSTYFLPFNISPDLKYRGTVENGASLDENDTVLVRKLAEDQTLLQVVKYVILENTGDNYIVLESTQAPIKSGELIQNKIKTVSKESLIGSKLYKDESKKTSISLLNSKQVLSNDYDSTYELLDYFAKKFGARVEFVNSTDNFKARVNNGIVEININKKPDSQSETDFIMELGIHEFMHLAITALKFEHPEVYLSLLQTAQTLEAVSSKVYGTSISQNEERLVRKITDLIMHNSESDGSGINITADNIEQKMVDAVKELLGLDKLELSELQNQLKTVIDRSKLFANNYSLEEMLIKTLRDEYMDKIKYECE